MVVRPKLGGAVVSAHDLMPVSAGAPCAATVLRNATIMHMTAMAILIPRTSRTRHRAHRRNNARAHERRRGTNMALPGRSPRQGATGAMIQRIVTTAKVGSRVQR